MLKDLQLGDGRNLGTAGGEIALDCSVRPTRQGHYVISTTDFFFPLVNSPYMQGWIGAANVLSDLYAQGVMKCDFVLMLLASCRDMPEDQRNISTREMVRGFNDACLEADTIVTGGQSVMNPWPIIGGVATSVVADGEFVPSDGAKVGDVVVLTKPLGTQIAVNVHQWKHQKSRLWDKCLKETSVTPEAADDMMHEAVCSMARLNRNAGMLMVRHGAHAATDVTGFGILGHAQNLADNQIDGVGIEIRRLPCLAGSMEVNDGVFNFRLRVGYSAETSGGLLVCLPEENAAEYCRELERLDGPGGDDAPPSCWIIGRVVASPDRRARIVDDVEIIEV